MFFSTSRQLPADAREAVRAYERRLYELLDSCADHQRHDPEVFLWNARRALEAMCHLLLTVHRQKASRVEKASNETSLDGMIKHLKQEGVLDREQAPRFDLARAHTNLGVHIQQPEKEDYAAAVRDTAHILPELLDWLYTDSIAAPHLRRPKDLPVDVIREGGRDGPSLKDAASVARREQEAVERTNNVLKAEVETQRKLLAAANKRWWEWAAWVGGSGASGLAIGLCAGVLGVWSMDDWAGVGAGSTAATAGSAAPTTVAPVTASVTTATAPPPAPQVIAVEAAAPAALTCPAGMLLVPAREGMLLGQPVGGRKNWPRPKGELSPVDVPAFCVDPGPRSRVSADAGGFDTTAARDCERNVPAAERPTARTCLTRDEAEAWCARAVPGGYLPGMLEWESAARAGAPGLLLPEQEWSGERFPPAPLSRSDRGWDRGDAMWVGRIEEDRAPDSALGNVLLSWNQQHPEQRHPERSFRCAAEPGAP